jgi:hypothetical protein
MGRVSAATTREAATEIVSVHLFGRAHEAGVAITRRWVDGQLERLCAHPPGCRCSEPYDLVRQVSPSRAYWTARTWQNSIRTRDIHGAGPRRLT